MIVVFHLCAVDIPVGKIESGSDVLFVIEELPSTRNTKSED